MEGPVGGNEVEGMEEEGGERGRFSALEVCRG